MKIDQLIQGVKKANPTMEKQLYVWLYERLFKVPLAYCKDKDEATGVFNHAMLYVFKNLPNLKNEEDLLKWAHRIIKNDCIDQCRKNATYQNKLSVVANQINPMVNNEVFTNLGMEEILQYVQQLDENYRLCFVLHVLEGQTFKEIAQQLTININTAKWYAAEAKKKLQQQIERNDLNYQTKTLSNF